MEEFSFKRNHVPPFGSWDYYDGDVPFTACFESARQPGVLRYSYSEDRDLYVAGDLYENDVVTPAMIVVPARHRGKAGNGNEKEEKWVRVCECECKVKEPLSPVSSSERSPAPAKRAAKAVDEDLYKISPHLLHAHSSKKKGWGFFVGCFLPTCVR